MYAQVIPALQKNLQAITKFLKKAEAHLDAQKLDKAVVLNLRVYPDMFPLLRQVLLVTDFSKGAAARLSGAAIPSFADDEKTFEDLYARIAKTEAFLASLDAKSFEGAEAREITMKVAGQDMTFPGQKATPGFINSVRLIVRRFGLKTHKEHHFPPNSPKVITGVAVTSNGQRLPNKRRRLLHDAFGEVAAESNLEKKVKKAQSLMGRATEAEQVEPRFRAEVFLATKMLKEAKADLRESAMSRLALT